MPLKILPNYLTNRKQAAYCNSKYSQTKTISTGIDTGTNTFVMYMNDLVHSSSLFEYTLCADDISLLMKDKDVHNLHSSLTSELHTIKHWIKVNKLRLNVSKTSHIVFQNRSVNNHIPAVLLEGESLQGVTHTEFFGMSVDENLNWRTQIDNVYMTLSRACGMFYKTRDQPTTEALRSIYYTLCYP